MRERERENASVRVVCGMEGGRHTWTESEIESETERETERETETETDTKK